MKNTPVNRKKTPEEALRESEALIRAILDTTVDGIITIDVSGIIQDFNRAAERLFGYSAEEAIGKNVKILMPPSYADRHDGFLATYLRTGEAKIIGIGREVEGQRKDGTTFPLEIAVSEVESGDRRLFTGIVRDISERRRAEEAIVSVSEAERRIIGQDLHDVLGQQLTGIALLSKALARDLDQTGAAHAKDATGIADMAQEAVTEARRLAHGL